MRLNPCIKQIGQRDLCRHFREFLETHKRGRSGHRGMWGRVNIHRIDCRYFSIRPICRNRPGCRITDRGKRLTSMKPT